MYFAAFTVLAGCHIQHRLFFNRFNTTTMFKVNLQNIPASVHIYANAHSRRVYIDDIFLNPALSQHVRNHSPDGFAWGFAGSGPAQLALAIMLRFVSVEMATLLYQAFKENYVATWPANSNVDLYLNMHTIINDLLQSEQISHAIGILSV